jgi:hypothetical protein
VSIIIENGTVVDDANSYVTEQELIDYAEIRGVTIDAGDAESLLIRAMDYIESLDYIGYKHIDIQPLQWPRDEVYIDTYYINRETIPQELKNGQMATAIAIQEDNGPLQTVPRNIKREKAGVVEVEYMTSAPSLQINRTINAALRKILRAGGASFRVVRA